MRLVRERSALWRSAVNAQWVPVKAKSAFLRFACWFFGTTMEELQRDEPDGRALW